MNIQSIKGTQDILPQESSHWLKIENLARQCFDSYGYQEIRTPIFEATELFKRSIGEVTDIVQKEMYTFLDKKGRSLTLCPEGTAPVVRAFLEHNLLSLSPLHKLFYIGPMFRYERPQTGRMRQFHQIGVEAIGSIDPSLDAEVIILLKNLLESFGLSDLKIKINSAGDEESRQAYITALKKYLSPRLEHLCPDCKNRYERNVMRILDCKVASCIKEFDQIPAMIDYLSKEANEHFSAVLGFLKDAKVDYVIEHKLVRGLDYYTRTVFEVSCHGLGAQDVVGAGGRYDRLIESMGGSNVPAIGFAIGLERVLHIIKNKQIDAEKRSGVFFAALGQEAFKRIFILVNELRKKGIKAEFDYDQRSLKAQMRFADKMNFKYLIIIGDNELKNNCLEIKDLETGKVEKIGFQEIVNYKF